MFRQADQQQEETAQRRAHQQVLHRVHAQLFQHLEHAHGHKGQHNEEQAIFGGAVAQGVRVHGVDEMRAELLQALAAFLLESGVRVGGRAQGFAGEKAMAGG
ncbi:hypothetical protein D3C72_2053100 [compost metagenome]